MLELLKDKLRRFDIEDFLSLIAAIGVAVGLVILLNFVYRAINADRTPKGYYLNSWGTDAGIAYRIKVSMDFTVDPVVFLTPDYKIALDTLERLNNGKLKGM